MINLTPIPENIQKRLFEKMRILGRTETGIPNIPKNGELTHDKLAIRTTFLRMTSGQKNSVTLMGGKLKDDLTIPGGYNDIYGPRTYNFQSKTKFEEEKLATGFSDYTDDQFMLLGDLNSLTDFRTVNSNKRPMPGVTSVDVSFKGGMRALREATISWSCWDWDELDALMPHFLAHGKTVMIEWGWRYV